MVLLSGMVSIHPSIHLLYFGAQLPRKGVSGVCNDGSQGLDASAHPEGSW